MVEVRGASATDLAALRAIDDRVARGDADRASYLAQVVQQDHCMVAVESDAVLGFVVVKRRHFFGRDFIELVSVAPQHRRTGVGRALVRAAVESATTADVFTSTNESNASMQSLLSSDGWELSGTLSGLDVGDPERVYFTNRRSRH